MDCPTPEVATTITTIIATSLLIISEALPYAKNIKGNGVIDVMMNVIKQLKKNKDTEELIQQHTGPGIV